jgi:monoamine oxidase
MSRSLYARLHRRFGQRVSGAELERRVRRKVEGFEEKTGDLLRPGSPKRLAGRGRVVVIGGGFGGLMAGYLLSEHFTVTVIEARDRVGGRVWSQVHEDTKRIIEAGAELIGYCHPCWIHLAETFELGLSVLTGEDDFAAMGMDLPLYLDGERVPRDELEKIYDEMTAAFERMGRLAVDGIPDPFRPWDALKAWEWDHQSLQEWIDGEDCSPLTKAAMVAQFANNNGLAPAQQSLLANLALVAGGALYGGDDKVMDFFDNAENVRCEHGNQALADRLAEKIRQHGGEVRLGQAASALALQGSGVSGDIVRVEIEGGGVVEADFAVLAIPQTLWHGLRIEPEIPADYRVNQGLVVKYLSWVRSRFWIPEKQAPSSVSNRFGMTWEGTDNQMQAPGQPVELSLFAGGAAAVAALERWHAGPKELHHFYDTAISQVYPGYREAREEWPRFMPWPYEPFTHTGYSCPSPGEVTRAGPLLYAPFHERIMIAGEHACAAYFGYMEGALQSGVRAAANIKAAAGF